MINLNNFAREVTLEEGLKNNLSIAQVKEVIRIVLRKLKGMNMVDVIKVIGRIK